MDIKIGDEVYVKHFNENLKIENVFVVGNEEERYVYQIKYQKDTYILKGFRIQVEHINPENEKSAKFFEKSLEQISEVLQEYHFARTASLINPHIAKPLYLDFMVDVAKNKTLFSYLHIQIIFEHDGISLDRVQPTTIEEIYNLMRQSANGLFLLHNLEIAHFDIKPANMVYDRKKDLLKIVDMGSAFGGSNRKRFGATTMNLEGKVRFATSEYAPPEVLFMERGLTKELNLKLYLGRIDVYCWAMSFFAILTNKKPIDLRNYLRRYKTGSEADYNEFIKIVETDFGSIKPKNSKEAELMAIISDLLTRALQYKPEERPIIKDTINKMKRFEKEKKYTLNYSKLELEHCKKLLNWFPNYDVDSSLNDKRDQKEPEVEPQMVGPSVKLSCGHEVVKDYLVKYTLELFIEKNSYEHSYLCRTCNKVQKLKNLPLFCGCIWTKFAKKIEYNNDLTKRNYGKCDKGHPLSSIDLGLVNDFVSFNFTSLMITEYRQEKENLVDSFGWNIKEESIKDIAWILKNTKAVIKLSLGYKDIKDEGAKVIAEALKDNTTLTELYLSNNNITDKGAKAIGEVLKTKTKLTQLYLSYNYIEDEGAKAVGEALKTNNILTTLYLSNNHIKDEGAKAIGGALKTNTTLTTLNLSNNHIKDEGAKAIGEAFKVNTTLKVLNLSTNELGAKGKELLKKAQEKYKDIEITY